MDDDGWTGYLPTSSVSLINMYVSVYVGRYVGICVCMCVLDIYTYKTNNNNMCV